MDDERRKNPRAALAKRVLIYNAKDESLLGHVGDLSEEGLKIIGDDPMGEGTELDLKMLLPAGWSETTEVDFTAQVCWWDQDSDEEDYSAGLQITDISDPEAIVIREILDLFGNESS